MTWRSLRPMVLGCIAGFLVGALCIAAFVELLGFLHIGD